MSTNAAERSGGKLLALGVTGAIFSGALTYLYFVSVVFLLAFAFLLWRVARRFRQSSLRPASAYYGVALSVASVVMPVVSFAAFLVFGVIDRRNHPDGTITAGKPVFVAIYTPPIVALVLLLVAAAILAARSRAEGSHADPYD